MCIFPTRVFRFIPTINLVSEVPAVESPEPVTSHHSPVVHYRITALISDVGVQFSKLNCC